MCLNLLFEIKKIKKKKIRAVSHPNVIQMIGYIEAPFVGIVTEYAAQGDLFTYIHSHKNMALSERLQKSEDGVKGLRFLHAQNIVHRDLKSTNMVQKTIHFL